MHDNSQTAKEENKVPKRKMKQGTRDILKCIIVLTAIAVIAGALLGVINVVTYVDADAAIISEIAEHYSVSSDLVRNDTARVIAEEGSKSYVKSCFVVLESASQSSSDSPLIGSPSNVKSVVYRAVGSGAYSGTLELLVFVEDDVIKDITVYSQSETKGIGSNALTTTHLSQYIGVNLTEIQSFKKTANPVDENDIKFITGATKTSTGVNNAINAVVYAYNNFGGAN